MAPLYPRFLVHQGHTAVCFSELVDAPTALLQVAVLLADTHAGIHVDVLILPPDQQRPSSSEHRRHKVERNVLAIEFLVDRFSDLGDDRLIREIVVQEADVSKRKIGENQRVRFFASECAKVVDPIALIIELGAARQGASHAVLAEFAPALEDKLEIVRPVVNIVVGEENALRFVRRVRPDLLVQAVACGLAIAHANAMICFVGGRGIIVEIVPDYDDLVQ